jgi:hypothetical protein
MGMYLENHIEEILSLLGTNKLNDVGVFGILEGFQDINLHSGLSN